MGAPSGPVLGATQDNTDTAEDGLPADPSGSDAIARAGSTSVAGPLAPGLPVPTSSDLHPTNSTPGYYVQIDRVSSLASGQSHEYPFGKVELFTTTVEGQVFNDPAGANCSTLSACLASANNAQWEGYGDGQWLKFSVGAEVKPDSAAAPVNLRQGYFYAQIESDGRFTGVALSPANPTFGQAAFLYNEGIVPSPDLSGDNLGRNVQIVLGAAPSFGFPTTSYFVNLPKRLPPIELNLNR